MAFFRSKIFKANLKNELFDPDEILADSVSALGSAGNLEGKMEKPLGKFSSTVFLILVLLAVLFLTSRAFGLQVKEGGVYFQKSQENRFVERPIFPPRGIIYDRFKTPLVENTPSFGLLFNKESFLKAGGDLDKLLQSLESILGKPPQFFWDLGFSPDGDLTEVPADILITQNIPPAEILAVASKLDILPGIQIFETYRRFYSDPFATAHLLGFVGKISDDDLKKNPDLHFEETIGKAGLEAFYDATLRGTGGKKIIETDSHGMETNFRLTDEPQDGQGLLLSVDSGLQNLAYELLKNYTQGNKGASIVAMDPRDGSILALVSFPGFDSNSLGYSLSQEEFNRILNNPLRPMFNRAISGEFPSGSTIKPVIASAALEEKIIDPEKKIYDEGFIEIPNPYNPGQKSVFLDWKKQGWINFYDAIAMSANVYFYTIGGGFGDQKGLGIEKIEKYLAAFGVGARLGIDLSGEKAGFIPGPETKKISDPQDPLWRVGDTYNVSIGQGGLKVTPLQMTELTAAVANGGTLYQPHVVSAFLDKDGKVEEINTPQIIRENIVNKDNLTKVVKGMRQTVTSGTARMLNDLPVPVAAKTGTAQAGTNLLPHAWITVIAPVDNPKIVLTVMVEHAGEGSSVSAPIAKELLNWYFNNRK